VSSAAAVGVRASSSDDYVFPERCRSPKNCNYPHRQRQGQGKKKKGKKKEKGDDFYARIPRAALLSTLRREEELRLCPELQQLYDTYDMPPSEIEAELQRSALADNGLCGCWLDSYWRYTTFFFFF
jgi:hypothetical protein